MAAPATLAGVTELADWIGEPIPADSPESKRAEMCLRIASALVRAEAGRTWLGADGIKLDGVPEDAVMVTLYCAGRVFDNREAQTRASIDDSDGQWRVDESGAYLTASEKRMLSKFRKSATGGLGTVATTRGECGRVGGGLVPVVDAPPFPWY